MINYKNLSLVILCAGEGRRIQSYFPNIPKSLIKIKSLEKSIVENTLTQFLKLNFNKIYIIYGYKANTFIKYFKDLESKDKIEHLRLNKSVFLVSAEKNYRKGPFHSFLEIFNSPKYDINDNFSLLIPGDTIFENRLIKAVLGHIIERIEQKIHEPLLFYRELDKNLIEKYISRKCHLISRVKILKEKNHKILKSIEKFEIRFTKFEEPIMQMVPIYFFHSKFLKEIHEFVNIKLDDFSNLTEFLNRVYLKRKKVFSQEINKSFNFFELDTIEDLHFLEENYKPE